MSIRLKIKLRHKKLSIKTSNLGYSFLTRVDKNIITDSPVGSDSRSLDQIVATK